MPRLLCVAVTLLFVGALLAQDATTPPSSQHAVLTLQGSGVQIYSCAAGHWVFVAPAARLFDKDGLEVGTHGDGPVWHLQDGSSVTGSVIAKSPSPDADSIPWLLVKATGSTGAGVLARAEYIRRSETKGGAAPSGGCDVKHAGDLVRVPYSATYTFYSSK
jgi:hypothetical protein